MAHLTATDVHALKVLLAKVSGEHGSTDITEWLTDACPDDVRRYIESIVNWSPVLLTIAENQFEMQDMHRDPSAMPPEEG